MFSVVALNQHKIIPKRVITFGLSSVLVDAYIYGLKNDEVLMCVGIVTENPNFESKCCRNSSSVTLRFA